MTPTSEQVEAIRHRRVARLHEAIPGSLVLFEGSLDYDFATVFAYLDALTEERDRLRAALEMTPEELHSAIFWSGDFEAETTLERAVRMLNILRAHAGLEPREAG